MVTRDPIVVLDGGREVSFSFDEMLNYHGGGSPGGVAHAFKVLERSLPLLDAARRLERRAIVIETAFGGLGARDAFELVTRAVSEESLHRRLVADSASAPERRAPRTTAPAASPGSANVRSIGACVHGRERLRQVYSGSADGPATESTVSERWLVELARSAGCRWRAPARRAFGGVSAAVRGCRQAARP
jgi:hypothetical protein